MKLLFSALLALLFCLSAGGQATQGTSMRATNGVGFGVTTIAGYVNATNANVTNTFAGKFRQGSGTQITSGTGGAVFGLNTRVGGNYAFGTGQGNQITSSGANGFITGQSNLVSAQSAAAFGQNGEASGLAAFEAGIENVAGAEGSVAFGRNWAINSDAAYCFGLGWGVPMTAQTNTFIWNSDPASTVNTDASRAFYAIAPGGIFLYGPVAAQTISVLPGGGFIGDGSGLTNLPPTSASGGAMEVNVKASPYNAVGDGVTDDTLALNRALTNGSVYFPAGTYLTDGIICSNSVRIRGAGAAAVMKRRVAGTGYVLNGNGYCLQVERVAFDGNVSAVKNIGLSQTNVGFPSEFAWSGGVLLFGVGPSSVRNCLVYGCGIQGIAVTNSASVLNQRTNYCIVSGNVVTNCYRGIHLLSSAVSEYALISGNEVAFNNVGISLDSGNHSSVGDVLHDNYIGYSGAPVDGRFHGNISSFTVNHSGLGAFYLNGCNTRCNIGPGSISGGGDVYLIGSTTGQIFHDIRAGGTMNIVTSSSTTNHFRNLSVLTCPVVTGSGTLENWNNVQDDGTLCFGQGLAPGPVITGNASGATNLNASNVSSGTLADARLSANVPVGLWFTNPAAASSVSNAFSTKVDGTFLATGTITGPGSTTISSGNVSLRAGSLYVDGSQTATWNGGKIGWTSSSSGSGTLDTYFQTNGSGPGTVLLNTNLVARGSGTFTNGVASYGGITDTQNGVSGGVQSNSGNFATIYPTASLNSQGATNLYVQGNQTNNGRLDISGSAAINGSTLNLGGAGNFVIQRAGATLIDGLSGEVSVRAILSPDASSTRDLGKTGQPWRTLYASNLTALNITGTNTIASRTVNTTTPGFRSTGTNILIMACPDGGSWILRVGNDGTLTTTTNTSAL